MTPRHGFTLIEVVVGLAVAATVLVLARSIVGAVGDTAERIISADAGPRARDAAGDLLRDLVGRAYSGRGHDTTTFIGSQSLASFDSWCPTSGGWLERCRVALVAHEDSTPAIFVSFARTRVIVRDSADRAGLLYLGANGGMVEWRDRWRSMDAVAAIGLVVDNDTLIISTGARR